jgi:hypothetical protein
VAQARRRHRRRRRDPRRDLHRQGGRRSAVPRGGDDRQAPFRRGRHGDRRRRPGRDRGGWRRERRRGARPGGRGAGRGGGARDGGERRDRRPRDAADGRIGVRGRDPRVGQAGGRRRAGRRDDRRDLHGQGRRRSARTRVPEPSTSCSSRPREDRHRRPRSSARMDRRAPTGGPAPPRRRLPPWTGRRPFFFFSTAPATTPAGAGRQARRPWPAASAADKGRGPRLAARQRPARPDPQGRRHQRRIERPGQRRERHGREGRPTPSSSRAAAAMLARYMDESPRDSDRPPSFRTITGHDARRPAHGAARRPGTASPSPT